MWKSVGHYPKHNWSIEQICSLLNDSENATHEDGEPETPIENSGKDRPTITKVE